MLDRKWWIAVPVLLVGCIALAVGLVPGVRGWLDSSMPQLGINGPTVADQQKSVASVSTEATAPNGSTPIAATPLQDAIKGPLVSLEGPAIPATSQAPVQFAQATFPLTQNQQSYQQPQSARVAQGPARTLEAVPPTGQSVPSSASTTGSQFVQNAQITFPEDLTIHATSDGLIMELPVDDGSFVKKGDLIVQLDTRLVESESEVAKQQLLAAELKAKDESNVKYSKAAAELAAVEVQISDELFFKGSEGRMDNSKKRLELTKASLQVSVSESEKAQQAAEVDVNKAKLAAAGVQMLLRRIPAHFDGVITEVAKRQFSFVRAGEPILRLTSMEKIRVKGSITPTIAPHLLTNLPARVTIDVPGLQERPVVEGVVTHVAPRTQGINDYQIYVNIQNQRTSDGQFLFREGMVATIEVLLPR